MVGTKKPWCRLESEGGLSKTYSPRPAPVTLPSITLGHGLHAQRPVATASRPSPNPLIRHPTVRSAIVWGP